MHPHLLIIRNKHKAFVTWYQYRCWFGQGIIFVPGTPDTNIISVFSFLIFFLIFVVCDFVKFSIYWALFSRIHTIKTNFPNFFKKRLAIARKFTQKDHFSTQNFFCFSTPNLFVMTVHVIFPSPPKLLQS